MSNTIQIYTDGACKGNPGPGGWGYVIRYPNATVEKYGSNPRTTNNRMEMTAALEALNALPCASKVRLVTDSQYLQKGMMEWLPGWKKKGWKNAAGKPVKNADLWMELESAANKHDVEWVWVRGHSGNTGNERADVLANLGASNLGASL